MAAAADTPIGSEEAAKLLSCLGGFPLTALAVSGGGDSMALMHLAARWAGRQPEAPRLHVLSVDHRLRPEAAREAAFVCERAAALGLPCTVLHWQGDKPSSGIQAAARAARYALLGGWCAEHGAALVTAHTIEDQAETLLMRLARGSGVDGLSAMAARRTLDIDGTQVPHLRPLLSVPRPRLRATLQALGVDWIEDPSNQDTTFERVRLRQALAACPDLHLPAEALALSAERIARARAALDAWRDDIIIRHASLSPYGHVEMPAAWLEGLPDEIALRVLARLITLTGHGGRPSLADLERLLMWLKSARDKARTLAGAHIEQRGESLLIGREPGRLSTTAALTGETPEVVWDGRFRITAQDVRRPLRICALARSTPPSGFPRRPADLPGFVWDSLPVICAGETAVCAPLIGWKARKAPLSAAKARFIRH